MTIDRGQARKWIRRAIWLAIVVTVLATTGVDTGGALRRVGKKPPAPPAPQAMTKSHGYELRTDGVRPRAGKPWRAEVSGRDGGQVSFDVIGMNEKLGHVGNGQISGGRFSAQLAWPKTAIGLPLALQASVQTGTGSGTVTLRYPVVVRAP